MRTQALRNPPRPEGLGALLKERVHVIFAPSLVEAVKSLPLTMLEERSTTKWLFQRSCSSVSKANFDAPKEAIAEHFKNNEKRG
jgi:hypothetical protein